MYLRLYFDPVFTELARFIGYGGRPLQEVQPFIRSLGEKYGQARVQEAGDAVTVIEGRGEPYTVRLSNAVRKCAYQLLGPPPATPTETPTAPIAAEPPADATLTRLNKRQLRCRLRDARARLEHNGKRSFVGKQAKKEIAAVEAEMSRRSMAIHALGQEVPDTLTTPKAAIQELATTGKSAASLTPMMQQYREAKERYPGALLLFRLGDFYEMFDEDAKTAARLLGLTLTTRDKTITMTGFPHHCLEAYLRRLLQAGQRIAICDQMEETRNPVRREVSRVVTPGSLTEPDAKKQSSDSP